MQKQLTSFSSFQDLHFVFQTRNDTHTSNINNYKQEDALDFCNLFHRLIVINNIHPQSTSSLIFKTTIEHQQQLNKQVQEKKQQTKNNESFYLSALQPQKLKIKMGNKLQKQVVQFPYSNEIANLRKQIVSSFTRIQQQLDQQQTILHNESYQNPKQVFNILNKSITQKQPNQKQQKLFSFNHSLLNSPKQRQSVFKNKLLQTPSKKLIQKSINKKRSLSKSVQNRTLNKNQYKQNKITCSPLRIQVSLKQCCLFPSNSILLKEPKHQIAKKTGIKTRIKQC